MRRMNLPVFATLAVGVVLALGLVGTIAAEDGPASSAEAETPGDQSATYIKRVDGQPVDPNFRDTSSPTPPGALGGGGEDGSTVVPEPGTLALIGLGLAGLGVARWRRRRK